MNPTCSSQPDHLSQVSTKSNENVPHISTENNLQKPKFQKKLPECEIKKQRSTLSLLNSKGVASQENKSPSNSQACKSEFDKVIPIFKYRIFFYSKCLEVIYEVFVCLQNVITVKEALLESIKSFNEKFLSDEIPIMLKEDESCFELYLSKKNGCAKKDLPSLDNFQTLSMTHIKTFTICERNDEAIFDLRKSSKTASTDSHDSKAENLDTATIVVQKSQSIAIANHNYANSLLNLKCPKDNEVSAFEDCQKHLFCGVWKLFAKKKEDKKNVVKCYS